MIELAHQVEGLSVAVRSRDVIRQAKGVLVSHFAMSGDDAFGLLARLPQHTNTRLVILAADFVARVRDRGPAAPEHCQTVTTTIEDLLAEAGHGATCATHPSPTRGAAMPASDQRERSV